MGIARTGGSARLWRRQYGVISLAPARVVGAQRVGGARDRVRGRPAPPRAPRGVLGGAAAAAVPCGTGVRGRPGRRSRGAAVAPIRRVVVGAHEEARPPDPRHAAPARPPRRRRRLRASTARGPRAGATARCTSGIARHVGRAHALRPGGHVERDDLANQLEHRRRAAAVRPRPRWRTLLARHPQGSGRPAAAQPSSASWEPPAFTRSGRREDPSPADPRERSAHAPG